MDGAGETTNAPPEGSWRQLFSREGASFQAQTELGKMETRRQENRKTEVKIISAARMRNLHLEKQLGRR